MRCMFCSNPDTWNMKGGNKTSSKELAKQIAKVCQKHEALHTRSLAVSSLGLLPACPSAHTHSTVLAVSSRSLVSSTT